MRHLLIAFMLILVMTRCRKAETKCSNTPALITDNAPHSCSSWGISVNGNTYPSLNIPAEFKKDGLEVCVKYNLYEDMRMCPCCGGIYASIISMEFR